MDRQQRLAEYVRRFGYEDLARVIEQAPSLQAAIAVATGQNTEGRPANTPAMSIDKVAEVIGAPKSSVAEVLATGEDVAGIITPGGSTPAPTRFQGDTPIEAAINEAGGLEGTADRVEATTEQRFKDAYQAAGGDAFTELPPEYVEIPGPVGPDGQPTRMAINPSAPSERLQFDPISGMWVKPPPPERQRQTFLGGFPETDPTDPTSPESYSVDIDRSQASREAAGAEAGTSDFRFTTRVADQAERQAQDPAFTLRTPQYREFEQWRLFAGKSPEYIAEVTQAMVAAGLLPEDAPQSIWTMDHAAQMAQVMVTANSRGSTWNSVVEDLAVWRAEHPEDETGSGRAPFTVPVYLEPDPDALKQATRQAFAGLVGRDPEDWELALYAKELDDDMYRQYQSEVTAARMEYDAQSRAVDTGEGGGGGRVQGVDPVNSMKERLLAKYGPEIEIEEDENERGLNTQLLATSLAVGDRTVGSF